MTMTELLESRTDTARVGWITRAALVALTAVAAALVDWALWTQAGGVDLRVDSGGVRDVGVASVVVSTVVCTLLGAVAATSLAAGLGLASLHLVVSAVAIVGLAIVARRRRWTDG
jgi:hypothetical protein